MRKINVNNKMNNKGFSLVEVIIAMSVLVIVSVPMLDTLSGTTTVTRKASEKQRATFLGQSISEGIKRYSTYELCQKFTEKVGASPDEIKYRFEVLDYNHYTFEDFARLQEVGGVYSKSTKTDIEENAELYQFGIFGIESGLDKYDALITMDSNRFEDINAEVIPEIVHIGAPGTGLIDISGLYNGKDLIEDYKKYLKSKGVGGFDSKNLKCTVNVVIKKNLPKAGMELSYEVYANIGYRYGGNYPYTYKYIGSRTMDDIQKLNYVYVLLSDECLYGENYINFIIDVPEFDKTGAPYDENIPIAVVTGTNDNVRWVMNVTDPVKPDGSADSTWRKAVIFFTNGKRIKGTSENKINFRGDVPVKDYATSGNKLKRIYGLKVELYKHNKQMNKRFQGEPIDVITSSYLRMDINEFNEQGKK